LKDLGVDTTGNHVLLTGTGTQIALMPAQEGAQSKHTVLGFEIENIFEQIKDLEGDGASFLDYNLPDLKTTDHVAVMGTEKAAWFADTEGNILCLHENPEGTTTR